MSNIQSNSFLETEPVGRLMKKYALPCIISLLVAALYNIVDQIFIANADYLGSYGNAANTVIFPLTVVALAVAVMIGDGACAFVSIALGAREGKKAGSTIGSAVLLSIVSGIVIMILFFVFQDGLITIFGGRVNNETFVQSKEYFLWITIGIPFYVFGQAMNPVIRSDGNPKFAMISTLAGALLNIILDPIFIFVFKWGMMGAALATILGQILTAVLAIWYLAHMKAIVLQKNNFHFAPGLMRQYLPLGICSFLAQISLVAAMAANNNMIQKYSSIHPVFSAPELTQIPMAVIGIVMKFWQIVVSIVVGMAAGCIPIVGFNVGAGRKDRAKSLFTRLLLCEALVGVIAVLIVEIFPRQIINIFGAANESQYYTEFALKAFRVYLCMVVFACVNKAAFIFLQSLGKPWQSTMLSVVREVVFGVGFVLILPKFLGLDGVLLSMPVSDVLTFIISAIVIAKTYKELNNDSKSDVASQIESKEVESNKKVDSVINKIDSKNTKTVIVIGRSFGSGGRSVGKLVAEKLSIPYYDKELLDEAAKTSGLSQKYLQSVDEKLPTGGKPNSYMLSDEPFDSLESTAIKLQTSTIESVAEKGSCVIVGRRADRVLSGKVNVLSIFLTSSIEGRIIKVSERERISLQEAKNMILQADKNRAAYYNSLSDAKWGEASNYALCLDTGILGEEKVASIICDVYNNFKK